MTTSRDARESFPRPVITPPAGPVDRARMGLRVQGRYRIASELGEGAFGTVCLADDEATAHQVAIRFLPVAPPGMPEVAQAVRRRGRSIIEASTAHPALVGVLEFGEADPAQAFVAMQYAEGRRLSEILAQGPLDVTTALRWAIELGGALETLHNLGIVHGALRPRNVMIADDGRVRLMDVELTDLREPLSRMGLVTTEPPPEYLAPEQIRRGPVSEKTDVYAFAAILYEMFCGAPPFRAETREATLAKHLTDTPAPMRRQRRAVPGAVASVVALALSKRPERRPLIHNILNSLWQEANVPAFRWKRTAAILVSLVLAASIPVVVGWGLLTPRPSVAPQPALAPPPPIPATVQVPPKQSPPPNAISSEPPPTPPSRAATPVAVPPAPQRAEPARATPPPASPATTRLPAPEQPPTSNSNEDPDPGAVVDWLLERAAARRK